MITLPTPEQLVINGLKFFLRMNKDVKVGQKLATITHPLTDTTNTHSIRNRTTNRQTYLWLLS